MWCADMLVTQVRSDTRVWDVTLVFAIEDVEVFQDITDADDRFGPMPSET